MKNFTTSQLFKTLGLLSALFILLSLPSAVLAADSYPSKPLRLIVPFAAGGPNDILGRLIAAKLTERLGKQVIVENRPGAGDILGHEVVAKADPNGYTFIIVSNSTAPATQKVPYDPVKDFTAIAKLGSLPFYLVVGPSVPATSLKELIALMKQKPGQLICTANGVATITHLASELFKIKTNTDFKIVQFKGGGPATIDMLGGHSDFTIGSIVASLPHIKSGKFRVLGISAVKRSLFLPTVPTFAEAGVPGYEAGNWFGILAPAGTPAPIVDRLSKEIKTILALDEVKKQLADLDVDVEYMGPTEFGSFREKELATWKSVVQKINLKLDY